MDYAIPQTNVFWVPVPYTGQDKPAILNYQFDKTVPPRRLELTNPETKQKYTVEILDYEGSFFMDCIPDSIARMIGGAKMTGKILAHFLKEKKEEFKNAERVLFYQVNPI